MDLQTRRDDVWKSEALAQRFLTGVRGGLPYAAAQIDVMLRLLAATGRPVERFIDLGCGDGILAQAIMAQYPNAQGTLVDFSEPMLAAARARLGETTCNFVQADFGTPGWVNAAAHLAPLDAVVSGFAIHHQPDDHKRRIYGEIFDLLAPGGIFVNVEHVSSPSPWVARVHDDLLIDALYRYHSASGPAVSRDEVASQYVHRPDKAANILAPLETQCAWLRELGYQDVDCYFKSFELAVFGGRRPPVQ
jgi:tRNA (cmo5U34)-methyltransferase